MTLPECEQTLVRGVYDTIAEYFDSTRKYIWKSVRMLLKDIDKGSKGIDIGCGNGRNMLFRKDLDMVGIDNCKSLVGICKKKGLQVSLGDATLLPYSNNTFDFAISMAVLHHLSTPSRRNIAVLEMIRILKSGGIGMISVWSVEQPKKSKRIFVEGDNIVSWKSPIYIDNHRTQDYMCHDRYYYIFSEIGFREWIDTFSESIHIQNIYNEVGNWYCIFKKK